MFYDIAMSISPDRRVVTVTCAGWDELNFTHSVPDNLPDWKRRLDTDVLYPAWGTAMDRVRAKHGAATLRLNDDGSFRIHAANMPARA